jgi:hypothetical protein
MKNPYPHFKYMPLKHIFGRIQFCTPAAKGIFIDICSYYWLQGCDMTETDLRKRFRENPDQLEELLLEKVIVIRKGKVCISFLISQCKEFTKKSKMNSINGKAGAKIKVIKQESRRAKKQLK